MFMTRQQRAPTTRRWQRGGTLLEAALVIPLLFMFLFAIIEFGRVYNMYQTITNAAREGARFGVEPCQSGDAAQTSCSFNGYRFDSGYLPSKVSVKDYVDRYLSSANMSTVSNVDVEDTWVPYTLNVQGTSYSREYRYVSVNVTADYNWIFFPFPNLTLHSKSVMKDELDLQR